MKMSRILHLVNVLLLLIGVTVGWSAFASYSLDEKSMIVGGEYVDMGCCKGEPVNDCSGCLEEYTGCILGYEPPWRGCGTDQHPVYEACQFKDPTCDYKYYNMWCSQIT
jgi:hypothetical protein